jgi:hypothetical protein
MCRAVDIRLHRLRRQRPNLYGYRKVFFYLAQARARGPTFALSPLDTLSEEHFPLPSTADKDKTISAHMRHLIARYLTAEQLRTSNRTNGARIKRRCRNIVRPGRTQSRSFSQFGIPTFSNYSLVAILIR